MIGFVSCLTPCYAGCHQFYVGPRVFHLKEETNDDVWEVENLYDLCFAPGRELLSSYRLREGIARVAGLSLLARDDDRILAGAVRYWPVLVAGLPVLLLGPVAVHPTRQGEGIGGFLVRESMGVATAAGWERVLLVGDAPYYARFGFAKLEGVEMPPPTNPDRVLGHELVPGAWAGVVGPVTRYEAGKSA